MIDVVCGCAVPRRVAESCVGQMYECAKCSHSIRIVSGEELSEGRGTGDFDVALTIVAGPERIGERLLLGGIAEIGLGKLPDRHITLPSAMVSRTHAKLVRVDFGPSRWRSEHTMEHLDITLFLTALPIG